MSVLERIIAYKRDEVAARKHERPLAVLEREAVGAPLVRGFAAALEGAGVGLIAEVKKASPSKGVIRRDFEPGALASAYERGGATCLSVLTDAPSFQGHEDFLIAARCACALPVLRKDFMVDPWQIAESRVIGADAILIIMAAVDDALAKELAAAAKHYGMDALVEVHDQQELGRALDIDARMIGINNRSLATFEANLAISEELAKLAPSNRLLVSESGIFTPADLTRLERVGIHAFLVGESLMRQDNVEAATRALLGR